MASALIGALRVTLGMNSAQFNRGADDAEARLQKLGQNLQRAAVAMAVAAGAALVALTKSALDTIDSQSKLATTLGTSVASIQTLQHAGDLAGLSMQDMAGNLQRMNRRLGEFVTTGGGPAATVIHQLGLNVQELLGMQADERVARIADAIAALPTPAQQAAAAFNLFGDAGLRMVPLLQGGGDAIRSAREELDAFGVTVSDVQAHQIEAANDAVTNLGVAFQGLGVQLAVQIAPKLEAAAKAITNFMSNNESLLTIIEAVTAAIVGGLIGKALGGIISVLPAAVAGIRTLVAALVTGQGVAAGFTAALSPVLAVVGAVAGVMLILGGRQSDAADAADVHRQSLLDLTAEVINARGRGQEYNNTLIDEKNRALDAAEANLALMEARYQALFTPEGTAGMTPGEMEAARDAATRAMADAQQGIDELRAAIQTLRDRLSSEPVTVPVDIPTPEEVQPQLDALRAALMSPEEQLNATMSQQVATVREALQAGLLDREQAYALIEQISALHEERMAALHDAAGSATLDAQQAQYDAELAKLKEHLDEMAQAEAAAAAARAAARSSAISAWASTLGALSNLIKDEGEKQFKIAKGLAIAEALINTAQAVTKALASGPPPWNFIQAAAVAASGAIQVAAIRRQQPNGSGSVESPSAGAGAGGGGAGLNQTLYVQGINSSDLYSGSVVRDLAEKLLDYQRDGGVVVLKG